MQKIKDRVSLLTTLLKGLSQVGAGTRVKIGQASTNAKESTSPLKNQVTRALADTINLPIIIRVQHESGQIQTFNVIASLEGKEVSFDDNVSSGTTLIIAVDCTVKDKDKN